MLNNYSFQADTTNLGAWNIFHRLQSVFQNANPADPAQTFEAVQHVLGDTNIIDHTVHPDSPRRDRPAYLDDPKEQFQHAGAFARPLPTVNPDCQKDWDAKPIAPPPKDWSILGR